MSVIVSVIAGVPAVAAAAPGASHGTRRVVVTGRRSGLHFRIAKPRPIAAPRVALWRGRPSYELTANHRSVSPAVVPGISGGCQITPGAHSGTWSPTVCPNGYEVQGDIKVPVGKTLTIKPNTVVYFDTTVEGSLGALDPSELPDLVVDGTLTVAGTAAQPVLFTSANAAPTSIVTPAAGDWGYVFFDHTAANKGTGSLTHLRLQYGEGLASDRSAPAITSSRINEVAAGMTSPTIATSITKGAGIDYEDVGDGTVAFTDDVFDFGQVGGVAVESRYDHTGFSGATYPGSPFTLALVDNHITGGSTGATDTVDAESLISAAAAAGSHSAVTLNVHGNTLTQTGDGKALQIDADSTSATVAGTAVVTGAFHDNVVDGGNSSNGIGVTAAVSDSSAAGVKACGDASACVSLPILRDAASVNDTAMAVDVAVAKGAGSSLLALPLGQVVTKTIKKHGKKVKEKVDVSGGSFAANQDGLDANVESEGTGSATLRLPVVATTFNTQESNIATSSSAASGTATTAVSLRHTTMTADDGENVDDETGGSGSAAPTGSSKGAGSASLHVVGGRFVSGHANLEFDDVSSGYGPASAVATVSGATMTANDQNLDLDANASEVGGSGGSTLSTTVTHSTLTSGEEAVEASADAVHGAAPATGKVSVATSTINAADEGVENFVDSDEAPGSHGNATADTSISHDTLQTDETAIESEAATTYGGAATSSPTVVDSTIYSRDEALQTDADSAENAGQGPAVSHPVITGSKLYTNDDILEIDASGGKGNSPANGSFAITGSQLVSTDDAGVEADAESSGSGAAVVNPAVKSSPLRAVNDDGYDLNAEANGSGRASVGGSFLASPIKAGESGIDADVHGDSAGSSAAFTTTITTTSIQTQNAPGITVASGSVGGPVTLTPTITSGSITVLHDTGINLEATGYGAKPSDVIEAAPVINHENIVSAEGVAIAAGDNHGAATPGSDVVGGSIANSTIVATDGVGLLASTICSYCTGGAHTKLKVSDTSVQADETGVEFVAETQSTTTSAAALGGALTSTHHNRISADNGQAVVLSASSSKGSASVATPITGLRLAGEAGGVLTTVVGSGGSATYSGSVTGNSVGGGRYGLGADNGIYTVLSADTNASDTGSIAHNTISDLPQGEGIFESSSAGGTVAEAKQIEDNTVSNVGSVGILVTVTSGTTPARSTLLTVAHNTVTRTGVEGLIILGARAAITANKLTDDGDAQSTPALLTNSEPYQGSVTCNAIWGNVVGIEYATNNPTTGAGGYNGDPVTNNNAFKDPGSTTRNALDLRTGNAGAGQTNAKSNFWGGGAAVGDPDQSVRRFATADEGPEVHSQRGRLRTG